MKSPEITEVYKILEDRFGPQHWWPGDSPFEIAVGAILTQQTAWKNVERAIENLKDAEMLDAGKIATADLEKIQELIRPSGYFRQKSQYLQDFCRHLVDNHGSEIEPMLEKPTADLRKELLALKGIGPETADSIIIYAAGKPVFVVDNYTIRACQRIGILPAGGGKPKYGDVRKLFEDALPRDARLFNEFHALFVALGKDFCTARKPNCGECPLAGVCEYPVEE